MEFAQLFGPYGGETVYTDYLGLIGPTYMRLHRDLLERMLAILLNEHRTVELSDYVGIQAWRHLLDVLLVRVEDVQVDCVESNWFCEAIPSRVVGTGQSLGKVKGHGPQDWEVDWN